MAELVEIPFAVYNLVNPVNPDWLYLPGFTFLVPAQPGGPGQSPRGL